MVDFGVSPADDARISIVHVFFFVPFFSGARAREVGGRGGTGEEVPGVSSGKVNVSLIRTGNPSGVFVGGGGATIRIEPKRVAVERSCVDCLEHETRNPLRE